MYKSKNTINIKEKYWYFRLVSSDIVGSRSLLDDYNHGLQHKLIICYAPGKIDGREMRTKEGKIYHLYSVFDSYLDYYHYYSLFDPSDRNFFEIILDGPQKPHFDIDIKTNEVNDIDFISTLVKDSVIKGSIEVLAENLISVDIEKDILIYSSHGENKRSFHIVINNKCHINNKEAKEFYNLVINKVKIYTNNKYIEFIDNSVYSAKQQFRMVGSMKYGSNRPKIFYYEFDYMGKKYVHKYCDNVPNIEIMKTLILQESLVSQISGCMYLPTFIPLFRSNFEDISNKDNLEQGLIEKCLLLMKEKLSECPFEFREIRGHLIVLKRLRANRCPICSKIHEHENPIMYIFNQKLYWDCRRRQMYNNFPPLFLGHIEIKVEETVEEFIDNDIKNDFMFGNYKIEIEENNRVTNISCEQKSHECYVPQREQPKVILPVSPYKNINDLTLKIAQNYRGRNIVKYTTKGCLFGVLDDVKW